MSPDTGNAPSWLFSFVDLAFLSLIVMTQMASNVDTATPDLGDMVVPSLGEEQTSALSTGAVDLWQLRVYPPGALEEPPFVLVPAQVDPDQAEAERIALEELRLQLTAFQREDRSKPLLAPHRDSRSQDLLDAAASIEEFWPDRRRVVVARNSSGS